jgi:hypothetical protein
VAARSTAQSTNGAASAQSTAQTGSLSGKTTAYSPAGGPAGALTQTAFIHGVGGLIPIAAGQAASYAVMTPARYVLAVGAMSAGYGGSGESLTYTAEADFAFVNSEPWLYSIVLDDNNHAGVGFDNLEFQVDVNGINTFTFDTDSLSYAETFFKDRLVDFGHLQPGNQTIDLIYTFTASQVGAGFGFTYNANIPEPATWAMMLTGFAGLGYAGYRRAVRGRAALAE